MNDQPQIDIAKLLSTIRRRLRLIVLIAVSAAVLAFGISYLLPDRYDASADLLFRQADPAPRVNPSDPPPDIADAPDRLAATNLALASLDSVVLRVKRELGSDLSIDELRERVDVDPAGQADIVTITASGKTAAGAARIANAFANAVVDLRRQRAQDQVQRVIDAIESQLATAEPGSELEVRLRTRADELKVQKELQSGDVELVESAIPPRNRAAPKPLRNAVVGGVVGMLLGVFLALLLARFDRRLESEEEIASVVGAPILARIPERKRSDWEEQLFLEGFQFLRANLQLRSDDDVRVIAVTSAVPGAGKSTVVESLSEAFALSGAQVIAVDGDLRRPTLHTYFDVIAARGLTTALVGLDEPAALLEETRRPNVRLLAAGPQMPMPASVLAGARGMAHVLGQFRERADYVLVDTSPVTVGVDASTIAAAADGAIMVVDVRAARRDVLEAAMDQLRSADIRILGVVLNRAEVVLRDSAYKGYYGSAGRSGVFVEPESAVPPDMTIVPSPEEVAREESEFRRTRAARET